MRNISERIIKYLKNQLKAEDMKPESPDPSRENETVKTSKHQGSMKHRDLAARLERSHIVRADSCDAEVGPRKDGGEKCEVATKVGER